jgi:hypothetical protein
MQVFECAYELKFANLKLSWMCDLKFENRRENRKEKKEKKNITQHFG